MSNQQTDFHAIEVFLDRVSVAVDQHVALVTLLRPDKISALDSDMFDAIGQAGAFLTGRTDIRAVVITGAGKGFCAGLDMSLFNDTAAIQSLATRTHGITNRFQQAAWVWHELAVPVIAAIHGPCLGGGFQLALGADIRIVHPQASMSVMEIKWGLVPDMAFTVLAPGLARDDILRELVFSGRVFSGEEALGYGFATRLSDQPLTAALDMARACAGRSPHAMRAAKRLLNRTSRAVAEDLLAESVAADALIDSENQREAVLANLQKRAPQFSDPEQ